MGAPTLNGVCHKESNPRGGGLAAPSLTVYPFTSSSALPGWMSPSARVFTLW